jgi:dipeptidyl aminopeptidase/acylaminoacyl peptidase
MSNRRWWAAIGVLLLAIRWGNGPGPDAAAPLGIFTDEVDVGTPSTIGRGSARFDAGRNVYTVSGGGENMWGTADHFHYVWKKVSGDVTLEATVGFTGTAPATGAPAAHRKACLVLRQTLEPDAVYADAAAHGDGLTSLQWRDTKGSATHEVQSNIVGPTRLRIEKRGDYVSMSIAAPGEALHPAGGSARVELTGDYYVGLGVTSHDPARIETVSFSGVTVNTPAPVPSGARMNLVNTLETINVRSGDRRVVYVVTQPGRLEAPNWFPDQSSTLYFNNGGRLYKIQAEPPGTAPNPNRLKAPEPVDLGILTRINNDHGVTADGKMWAISDQSQTVNGQRPSLIYAVPTGGGAKRLTEKGPSYFHGWSPDGKTLAYCAQRNGNFDVYTISVDGGPETRLTTADGKDDGPEYSPDGQYIYFNSERTGTMQIWRMKADGSEQEAITKDETMERWFPHISPDGKSMVFLTYEKGAGDHPENKDIALRLMDLTTRDVRLLAKLFGGQGTINVSSWSPDSRYLAFVSYQLVPAGL